MKRLLLSVGLMALTSDAHAQIFNVGQSFTISLLNSPNTTDDTITLTLGIPVLINNDALSVTVAVVNAGGNKQWILFQYQTLGLTPLSQDIQNWSINQFFIPTLVATNFIADYTQWTDVFANQLPQFSPIFSQTLMSSPVPGLSGSGEGSSGFSTPFPAGTIPELGAHASPFQMVANGLQVQPTSIGGFTQALEFEPQVPIMPPPEPPEPPVPTMPVPEPSTWALMALGFGLLGLLGYRKTRSALA